MAARIHAGMSLLVIDTENKFVSSGMAEKLAQKACGKYYYLPNGTDQEIAAATAQAHVRGEDGLSRGLSRREKARERGEFRRLRDERDCVIKYTDVASARPWPRSTHNCSTSYQR